jgi:hypothetical protein
MLPSDPCYLFLRKPRKGERPEDYAAYVKRAVMIRGLIMLVLFSAAVAAAIINLFI